MKFFANNTPAMKLFFMLIFVSTIAAISWFIACEESGKETLSDNCYLLTLEITSDPLLSLTPENFDRQTYNYSSTSCGISSIRVRATAEDEQAEININGIDIESGVYTDLISISPGMDNIITIQVTAQNGSAKEYSISIDAEAISCNNSCKDGNETDLNCGGGTCGKCNDKQNCFVGNDCLSKVCTNNKCMSKTCADGVQNGTETDVDCGGSDSPNCAQCPPGKKCLINNDCATNSCVSNICK